MAHNLFGWKTKDGLILHGQMWRPEGQAKGLVCLVHGLGEHSGRYAHLAAFLTQAGYALAAFDLRGHGQSEGQRGHASRYQVLMDDITDFLTEVKKHFPDDPCFLYGHSLGGNLVINYGLRQQPDLHGLIVSAPVLRLAFEPPIWKMTLGKMAYKLWPTLSMPNGLDVHALSRDTAVLVAYQNDPWVHDHLSAQLGFDILEAGAWALEHAAELSPDMLLMHGGADQITAPEASREFAAQAGERCQLKIWEGLYHEINNEPEKETVFAYLLAWLEREHD